MTNSIGVIICWSIYGCNIIYIYIYVDPELNVYVDQIYRIYKCGGLILLNYVELGSNW